MADKVLDWRAAPRLEPGPPQTREGGGAVSQPWERGIKKSKNKVRVGSGVAENREAVFQPTKSPPAGSPHQVPAGWIL